MASAGRAELLEVAVLIDCDTCRMRDLACSDCVVSLLLGTPDASADLDADEAAAFGALAGGGLSPPLRLVPIRAVGLAAPSERRPSPRRTA